MPFRARPLFTKTPFLKQKTRREWLASVATPCALAVVPGISAAAPVSFYGVDVASIRGILRKDPDKVLHDLAAMGFKEIEGASRTETVALAPQLKQAGLAVRSCHCETPLVTADWDSYPDFKRVSLSEAIDSLKSMGAEYFTMGDISIGARGDGDDFYRRTADRMNDVGQACRKAGLKFAWQTQTFQFEGNPGLRPIDIYRERLDAKLAPMEIDVFRVSLVGLDPANLFKQWKGRVAMARLIDRTKGVRNNSEDTMEAGAYSNLGQGVLDFPAILKAAARVGVRIFSVGQAASDESAADPLAGLRANLAYLGKLHG
jgi:sugar phosphate isomerase/epimerase